ncbi:MAG: hypothetical protein KF819_21675 [Labilithrix sp.]|nr:hypothetical protein [Labilithrix sp.]
MKNAFLVVGLSVALGCSAATPSASPSGEPVAAPQGDRIFVEAATLDGAAPTTSVHMLVRDDVPSHLSIPPTVLDVRARVVDPTHVRLELSLVLEGAEPMTTTVIVADKQSLVLREPKPSEREGRAVVVRSTIVRSDADLEALLAEKIAARASAN